MNSHALTLAISLLSSSVTGAVAGAALVTLDGCVSTGECVGIDPWGDTMAIDLGVSADLHAVIGIQWDPDDQGYSYLAVGAGGTIVAWTTEFGQADQQPLAVEEWNVGGADLRAISADDAAWWVVGDDGFAAVSEDGGQTWTTVDLAGSTADLHAIASVESRRVVVGDDVVLVQADDGTWSEAPAPGDGWGQLRAVYYDGARIYAVGLGGVIWSATDPSGEWVAEDSGVDTDLLAIGGFYAGEKTVLVVGAQGRALVRKAGAWDSISTGLNVDFIDYEGQVALGTGGELYEVRYGGAPLHVGTVADARALTYDDQIGMVAIGDGGAVAGKSHAYCIGGRPFIIDGTLQTASLNRDDDRWCAALAPTRAAPLPVEFAQALAAAWAQDGLYEHASIASFARFSLELLALAAPPRLLRAVQLAIGDELRHAQLCFGLARRFANMPIGPGPTPIPSTVLARVGDPVATALGLFDEACINESVAACEAAEAAAGCRDPETRRILEIIAADERAHAVAAWDALRWLLETYGERVAEALRARLARLGVGPLSTGHEDDPQWNAYGRLSSRRRSAIRRRVLTEFVHPFAHALLEPIAPATTNANVVIGPG